MKAYSLRTSHLVNGALKEGIEAPNFCKVLGCRGDIRYKGLVLLPDLRPQSQRAVHVYRLHREEKSTKYNPCQTQHNIAQY